MSEDNFLDSFNASLTNLVQFNDKLAQAITSDKQNKDDFLQYVNTELGTINNKIKTLEGLINAINDELNKLRAASDNNTTIINDNNTAKASLEQKIKELESIEADLKQQLMEANKKSEQLQTELQRQIDDKEAEIQKLNGDNQTLKSQADALQKQLDEGSQSNADQAAAIKKLTDEQTAAIEKLNEEHKAALENQMNENNTKIAQLTAEIEQRDKKIDELTNNSSSQLSSIQAELDQCKQAQAETAKQIEALTSENQTLKTQNEQYKKSIEEATVTINQTVSKLNEILQQIPNAQDRSTITALFNEINAEIEKLSGLLSGQQAVTQAATAASQEMSSPEASTVMPAATPKSGALPTTTPVTIDGIQMPIGGIAMALNKKSRDLKKNGVVDTKYKPAFDELIKATSVPDAEAIIKKYDLLLTQDKQNIKGGKTKKIYRKRKSKMYSKRKNQKGGFTYNKSFGKKKTSSSYKSSIARGRKSLKKSKM
jgi:predicted  nucleic acid-binding Zn-ribbon protein